MTPLWDDDDAPATQHTPVTYGDPRYSHDDDDERELMQRTCDCIVEHAPGLACVCECHTSAPDHVQRGPMFTSGGGFRAAGTRVICGYCYDGAHKLCRGILSDATNACECRRCGDDAENGA